MSLLSEWAAVVEVPLQVAFLDKGAVAVLTVEGLVTTVHADVGGDAE